MKKSIITIIIMLTLIISIVSANSNKDTYSNLPIVGTQAGYIGPMKIIPLDPSEVKNIAKEHPDLISKRYIPKQVKEKTAEEKLKLSKEEENVRERIKETKSRINEIKNSKFPINREEKIIAVSSYLSSTIQLMIIKLSRLENDIYKTKFIDDNEALQILSWIKGKKTELQYLNKRVSSFNNQTPKSEILSSVEEIKDAWEKSKEGIKGYSQDLANSKVDHNLAKLNLAKTQLSTAVKDLNKKGRDTQALTKIHEEYSKDLASASLHLEKAKQLAVNENYEEAKQEYEIAKKDLLEGTKKLSKLTTELSEVGPFQLGIKEAISTTEKEANIQPATILPPYSADSSKSIEPDEQEPQKEINMEPSINNYEKETDVKEKSIKKTIANSVAKQSVNNI